MKKIILSLLAAVMLTLLPVSLVAADTICSDPAAKNSAYCVGKTTVNPIAGPNGILIQIANVIAIFAGIILVIMMIIAGMRYVTSSGDSAGVEKAKNTIFHLLIGIIIIVLARVLVVFVVGNIK
ncbi:MAG: hypothetical protein ABI602_04005 [Candidatus Saccharibacteria bacterium]